MALSFLSENQKNYGKKYDIEKLVTGFEFVMAEEYSVEQVLYALKLYMKTNSDMPAAADIISILSPEERKITEAEYVNAVKYQERHNWYDMFSDAQMIIDKYREQNKRQDQNSGQINADLLAIAKKSVKMIS